MGKERPIIFSGEMVRAILDGRKTQTRRVAKLVNEITEGHEGVRVSSKGAVAHISRVPMHSPSPREQFDVDCPYGIPGDRLWVRETWACVHGDIATDEPSEKDLVRYRADDGEAERILSEAKAWKPSIHMPRAYSRLSLEVVSVRVERLQEMKHEDALAEGFKDKKHTGVGTVMHTTARNNFANLWNELNEKRGFGWDKNPWVWVIEFKKFGSGAGEITQ